MPRYFFHLSFGDRLLPDDEGVELASRAAARQEALAVMRELAGSAANRWASWFLRVADRKGEFLSLPIGHPALQLVSSDGPFSASPPTPDAAEVRVRAAALTQRAAAMFEQASELRRRTADLLERNRQLRAELSAEFRCNRVAGDRARQLVAYARQETAEPTIARIAAKRRSPPRLVLIQGEE